MSCGRHKEGCVFMKKSTKILIIVLCLIIVGLITFIVVDKVINAKKESKSNNENNSIVIDEGDSSNKEYNDTTDEKANNALDEDNSSKTTKDKIDSSKIKVEYETRTLRELKGEKGVFRTVEVVPTISGIDKNVASKIENNIKKYYKELWENIDSESSDDEVYEIINNTTDYEIGFKIEPRVILKNDTVITFEFVFSGGLGGVAWDTTSGTSYDLTTGNEINIDSIVTNKQQYIDICYNYVIDQIEADDRYDTLYDEWKEIVKDNVEEVEGYFTNDGIVCTQIGRYSIGPGAAGEFTYAVPYELVKDCIDSKYCFK